MRADGRATSAAEARLPRHRGGRGRRALAATLAAAAAVLVSAGLVLAPAGRAGAESLDAGDLLVSDHNNARVLVVEPATGHVWRLAPRGASPNLLVAPAGIAMCQSGTVFVADETTNHVIAIDPVTGNQSILSGGFPLPTPVNPGAGPFGLAIGSASALAPDPGTQLCDNGDLWMAARESTEVRRTLVQGNAPPVLSDAQVASDAALADARGAAIGSTGGPLVQHVVHVALGAAGWTTVYPADGSLEPGLWTPGGVYDGVASHLTAVLLTRRVEVLIAPGLLGCNASTSGVDVTSDGVFNVGTGHYQWSAPAAVSLGGSFRCPVAIATASDGTAYVTDTLSPPPVGGSARVVRLSPSGTWGTQALVAEIPNGATLTWPAGIAVAPVTVPEPGAGAEGAAAGGLLLLLAGGVLRRPCAGIGRGARRNAS